MVNFFLFAFGENFTVMRHELESIIKTEFRSLALKTRARFDITQEQMAERLAMGIRSYYDIESGVCMCGSLTILLLLMDQPDPAAVLGELKQKFKALYKSYETGEQTLWVP